MTGSCPIHLRNLARVAVAISALQRYSGSKHRQCRIEKRSYNHRRLAFWCHHSSTERGRRHPQQCEGVLERSQNASLITSS